MGFHDTRLPVDVERGAQGGPGFKTTIMALSSGHEKRNEDWERTRGSWDVGYGIQELKNMQAVVTFFYARRGRAHSFRFKDWADYTIGDAETNTPQAIGVGTGAQTTFQIEKRYTDGGETFARLIEKPITGTLRVFLNGVEQFSGWSADYLTGIITFNSAPGNAVVIAVISEFDVPVRFDTDKLDITVEMFQAGAIPQIPLVEVRGE